MSLTETVFLVTTALGVGAYLWFRWSDNVALKKRLWTPFILAFGGCLALYFTLHHTTPSSIAGLSLGELLGSGIMLVAIIISQTTRFCRQCATMEVRKRNWFKDGDACRFCGHDLRE